MKKFLVVILIIIAIPIIVFVTYRILQIVGLHKAILKDTPEMSMEELTLCLKQNKDDFTGVSNILSNYPSILDISGSNVYGKGDKNKFYYKTKNQVYLKSRDKLDNYVVSEIENSKIKFIFENLKFESIIPMEDCIYFVKASNLGYASGIVYSPKKEKPQYEYLISLEKVEEKWFYFRFR